jgi:ElaA protein
MALRQEVFVVEQTCFYQDADGADLQALHLLGYDGPVLVAYLRIIPAEYYRDHKTSIGRVVVKMSHRHTGLGKALFLRGLEQVAVLFGNVPVVISAQHRLLKFYTDLGFTAEGAVYLEDDIPHIKMLGRAGS